MKFLKLLFLIVITIKEYYTITIKSEKKIISIYKIDNDFKLPEGLIKSQGWFRFSNFEKNSPVKPDRFIKNMAFSDQFKGESVVDLKAEDNVIDKK